MSSIVVQGVGAVSPAGWGAQALARAVFQKRTLPVTRLEWPGSTIPLFVRQPPPANPGPQCLSHARLRRASSISQYAVAAAFEALGPEAEENPSFHSRLGVIFCVMTGSVCYSRRFFDETLKDPSTASPLLFPETVFNAPASHLGAMLGATLRNYTLVGDQGVFLQGLAMAADWLQDDVMDGCLVVGTEEADWSSALAYRYFLKDIVLSGGAGAVYLRVGQPVNGAVCLESVTSPQIYSRTQVRAAALQAMRAELPVESKDHFLCDSTQGIVRLDRAELKAWEGWAGRRCSPKLILGEGMAASSAWQCVIAVDGLRNGLYPSATISVAGCNQQAIGACLSARSE
ncbi:MAG: hypothetical protein O2960_12660 [Verrucomicrobia bacterium]|nr:hypothetical protein [Verrucomicrobiota bacterium]